MGSNSMGSVIDIVQGYLSDGKAQGFLVFFLIVGIMIVISLIILNIENKEEAEGFVYWKDYLSDWIISSKDRKGYRYNNDSGCYVILIFKHKVRHNNFRHYADVYVGQSARVCNRVHNHFIGKGNGDVYADVKYGRKAYVKIIFCGKNEMNALEKKLIKKYNAMDSYNRTSGGSTDWVEKEKRRKG